MTPDADIDRNTSKVELSLLRDVLPYPCTDHDKVMSLERVARQEPSSIRSYIHGHAIILARNSDCEHVDELATWTYENRERVTTSRKLRAERISGVNMRV